jgi:hypothetical protein
MINWRNPLKELPEQGEKIFYVDWHWKMLIPGSYKIIGGTFEKSNAQQLRDGVRHRVDEWDEHGGGGAYLDWPRDEDEMLDCDYVGAWCPASEINLPEWLL